MIAYYEPVIVSAQEYYPFGMMMRQSQAGKYRYGFNGKENDNEVKGIGNQQDYGNRVYDNRLGRFLSIDPLTKQYPWLTPYQFSGNSPVANIDLDGLETSYAADGRVITGPFAKDPLTGGYLGSAPPFGTFAYFLDHSKKIPQPSASQPKLAKQDNLQVPAQVREKVQMAERRLNENEDVAYHTQRYGYDPRDFSSERPASVDKPKPFEGRSDFERGMITSPATTATIMAMCPECAVAYGGAQVYSGVQTGNYLEVGAGALSMIGGGVGLYAKFTPGSASAQLAEMESNSGGHFLSRHGAQTSLSSQYQRAISGMTPEGIVLAEVNASRFFSHEFQLEAAKMAQAMYSATGKSSFTMNMGKVIGEGFLKGGGAGSYRVTNEVQAFFKDGNLNTLFPLLKK